MARRNVKRPRYNNRSKGNRNAKEAAGDDSESGAIADSPVYQYHTRAKEAMKRKASEPVNATMDSGDEDIILAAGRAQEGRKQKAKRTRHKADSDDEMLPVSQLQLPFLQEETEEEVNMCEISLKALISRKQQIENELSRSRYVR
jgi:hypothetical protein